MNAFTEPSVWGAIAAALFVGYLIGFLSAALMRGNDDGRPHA